MNRQTFQAARHDVWIAAHGVMERPVQLDTYLKPHQAARYKWLKSQAYGTILEVGCSWGYILAYVGGQQGVDINPNAVEIAKVLARERQFQVATATDLPFEDGSFDTVMLPEVLEHMNWEHVPQAITEALRVAKRRVLITLPDGREDTEDATNAKHVWIADDARISVLTDMLVKPTVDYVEGFLCMGKEL